MQRNSDLKAVGVFTGIRGNGIVILDVDRNLKRCMKRWGESLAGAPMVTSTKQNAAKFIFRVPENLWKEVKGRGWAKRLRDPLELKEAGCHLWRLPRRREL